MAKTKVKTPGTDLTATAATGAVIAQGTPSVTDGYITLNCDQNTHGVKIKSPPHSAAQTYTLTLPSSITNNYFLQTDGSGNLSFSAVSTYTDDLPTITSLTPSIAENTATAIVIAGTNFVSVPTVDAINSSTGAIVTADSVSFTSTISITATFTLPIDGTYYVRVENNNGLAVRTTSASLTVSDAPAWVTEAGSLGSFPGLAALPTQTLTATDAVSFAITTGAIATSLTFTTGVGSCTIEGTQTEHSVEATDSFTVTATDAEGQTAARAFTMSWTFGASSAGQFN